MRFVRGPARACVDHLLAVGILDLDELFLEGVEISRLPGRNCVLEVRTGSSGYVYKEYVPRISRSSAYSTRELNFYSTASESARLCQLIPRAVNIDREAGRLVVEISRSAETAFARLARDRLETWTSAEIGKWLAILHSSAVGTGGSAEACEPPVSLEFGLPNGSLKPRTTQAGLLLEAYNSSVVLVRAAAEARSCWSKDVFVHGDLRLSNTLISPDGTASIIDWETAGRGPAFCDLGYYIGSAAHTLARSRPASMRSLYPHVQALLGGYRTGNRAKPSATSIFRFAGLSYLQLFFEDAQSGHLTKPPFDVLRQGLRLINAADGHF